MMKTIEQWLDDQLQESERYQNLILNRRLNDASGLGEPLRKLIGRGRAERPAGVLLTGPSGSGKHHAAWHILQALSEEDCAPVFLSGADLAEGIGTFSELTQRLNGLLDRFYDRGQGLCLVLEEPEDCGFGSRLYPFLGRTAQEYRSNPDELPPLFLVLIAERRPPLSSLLLDQLLSCCCTLPDPEQRNSFLADRAKLIRNYVSLKDLAEETDGCSYAELGQIAECLGFLVDTTGVAPNDRQIRRCVRQFLPAAAPNPESKIAGSLERLEGIFTDLSDRLAQLSFDRAVNTGNKEKSSDSLISSDPNPQQSPAVDRSAIEEMSVRDLSVDLFGEDRMQQLLQN